MKQFKTEDQKEDIQNWVFPGNKLSHEEFLHGITKAENGPFCSVEDSMKNFEQWLKTREKK